MMKSSKLSEHLSSVVRRHPDTDMTSEVDGALSKIEQLIASQQNKLRLVRQVAAQITTLNGELERLTHDLSMLLGELNHLNVSADLKKEDLPVIEVSTNYLFGREVR